MSDHDSSYNNKNNIDNNDNPVNNNNENNNKNNNNKARHFRGTWNNIGEEALGGFAAGIVGTVIGFPLDVIKTRLQTGGTGTGRNGIHSQNMIQVGTHIVRTEGISSLYKGLVPPLLSLSLINTLSFTSYSYFRRLYGGTNGWDVTNSLAGLTGCPMFSIITTPENFVKTQMQLDNVHLSSLSAVANCNNNNTTTNTPRFRGSFHCASVLMQQHGLQVLYTGHVVNTLREGAFLACYFYMYEGLRQVLIEATSTSTTTTTEYPYYVSFLLNNNSDSIKAAAIPIAGGLAGASAWFFSFPLDCVRAGVQGRDLLQSSGTGTISNSNAGTIMKQQQLGGLGQRRQTGGAVQVFLNLIQTKGIMGLYRGVGPSIARAFLVSGSRFSAYEGALWLLRGGRDEVHAYSY